MLRYITLCCWRISATIAREDMYVYWTVSDVATDDGDLGVGRHGSMEVWARSRASDLCTACSSAWTATAAGLRL